MPIIDGMNNDFIEYFPLEEYVKKIKLSQHPHALSE